MPVSFIQATTVATGNSTSAPINASLTGVVAGRWGIGFGACYNPGTMGASAFSDDKSNSWTNRIEEQTGGDVFNVAIGTANLASAGSIQFTLSPSSGRYPTAFWAEIDAPSTSTLNTGVSNEGVGSTVTITGNAPTTTDNISFLALSWYSDDDPSAAIVSAGWTLIRKQVNFSGLTQTLAAFYKVGTTTTAPTFSGTTGLGGSVEWVATIITLSAPASILFQANVTVAVTTTAVLLSNVTFQAAVNAVVSTSALLFGNPAVFSKSNRTNGGSFSAVANDTLTFDVYDPQVGDDIIVSVSLWSQDVSGFPSQGITPTNLMVTDNNGGTSGSYVRDDVINATDGRTAIGGNVNTPGVAFFRRKISSISTLPFTVTFTIDPSSVGEGYWSWQASCVSGGLASSPLDHSSKAWIPFTLGDPDPTEITFQMASTGGPAVASTNKSVVFYHGHNSFHEDAIDIADPAGYNVSLHNEENSLYLSGHAGWKLKTDASGEDPRMAITGSGVLYVRGLLVIYKLPGGVAFSNPFDPTTVSVSGSISGTLTTQVTLASSLNSSVITSAALLTEKTLVGNIAASVNTSATLLTEVRMAAAVSVAVTTTAPLLTEKTVVANVATSVTTTATLTTEVHMATAVTCSAVVAGALLTGVSFDTSVQATTSTSAPLTTEIRAVGNATVAVTTSANLTTEATLIAASNVTAAATGVLSTEIRAVAAALATSVVAGNLTTEKTLVANVTNTVSTSASLSIGVLLDGSVTCSITCTGVMSVEALFVASADTIVTTSAVLTTQPTFVAQVSLGGTTYANLTTEKLLNTSVATAVIITANLSVGASLIANVTVSGNAAANLITEIAAASSVVISSTVTGNMLSSVLMIGNVSVQVAASAGQLTTTTGDFFEIPFDDFDIDFGIGDSTMEIM